MATVRKIRSGIIAQRNGAAFESFFELCCRRSGVSFVRIPDGCRRIGGNRLIRVRSPFDYCLCFGKIAAHIDTKTTKQNSFGYAMLNWHQLSELSKLSSCGPAGYVIQFGDGRVYFADISVLRGTKPGESVNLTKCVLIGSAIGFDCGLIFSNWPN